ncbi:hypothetical protein VDGL01_09909 [Verticillium dahliae]
MVFTMRLSKTDWDECDDLASDFPEYIGTFVSEAYGYCKSASFGFCHASLTTLVLTLPELEDGLYYTDIKEEKDYYDLWKQLLPIISDAPDDLRQTFEPICQGALEELRKEYKNFRRLCTFLKRMIRAIRNYIMERQ